MEIFSAKVLLKEFLHSIYKERNLQKACSYLADDVFWIGVSGCIDGIQSAEIYINESILTTENSFSIHYLEELERSIDRNSSAVDLRFVLSSGNEDIIYRMSAIAVTENQKTRLKHLHMSVSDTAVNLEKGTTYSLKQEYENKAIRDFFNKSIAGGVIGCYLEDGFPFYFINDMMADYLGFESEKEFSQSIEGKMINAIHPEDRQMVIDSIAEQLRCKDDYTITYRMRRKDGTYIWMHEIGAKADVDSDREVIIAVCTDISEQYAMEEKLKLSNLQLENIVNAIPGGVAIYKVSDIFETVYFSNGVPVLSGYTVEEYNELIKQDAANMTYYEDTDMVVDSVRDALRNDTIVDINFRKQHRDGSIVWVHMQGRKIGEEDGCPLIQCVFHNITDLMEKEKQLQESERKQALAIEGADMSIWEYDIQNKCIYQSAGSIAKHGFSECIEDVPESLIEQGYVHENDVQAFRRMYEKLWSGEPKAEGTFWVKDYRNDRWWSEHITYSVEFDLAGRPVRAYGASRDTTLENLEKKKYEEELSYVERMGDIILSCCRINLSQKQVEDMRSGLDIELGENYRNALDFRARTMSFLSENYISEEKNAALSPETLIQVYKDGHNHVTEVFPGVLKSGEHVWIKTEISLVTRFNSSDVIAFFYNTDITNEMTMKMILESIMRFEYDEITCIYLNNDRYSMMAGKSTAPDLEMKGVYSQQLPFFCEGIIEEERDDVCDRMSLCHLKERLDEQKQFSLECHMVDESGESRLKQLRFMYLDQRTGMVLLTKADIDEVVKKEKRKQELLELALDAAEKANRAKSEFLSRISHDLRTPMNAILGLSNLGLEAENMDDVIDCLRKISNSGQYLLSLINDTLDVSRIEQKGLTLKPQIVFSEDLLNSIVEPIKVLALQKNIDFVVHAEHIEHQYLYTDGMRVRQVFSNLLSNAVKFTPERGRVELRCYCVAREGSLAKCKIVVKDNGIGMSPEFLEKIYEPFEQESNEVTPVYQGSGLGMTIVKSLVEMMNGRIEVKSEQGKGTEYTVYLDFQQTEGPQTEIVPQDSTEADIRGMQVLLVEDHPLNAEIAIRILEKEGCLVDHAKDGAEGVERFKQSDIGYYEAVLMDIRMPNMDGLQAAAVIRNLDREDAKSIPIIAMTANAYNEDREKSLAAGMDHHLTKPIVPKSLYAVLSNVRRNR